jgi:hypothetical protein
LRVERRRFDAPADHFSTPRGTVSPVDRDIDIA